MVGPVNSVNANNSAYFRGSNQDLINSEGKFTEKAPIQEPKADSFNSSQAKEEKNSNHTLLKTLGWTAAALALVIGSSFTAKHFRPEWCEKDASWFKKAITKPADWCEQGWERLSKLWKSEAKASADGAKGAGEDPLIRTINETQNNTAS